jgi:hypothetical protein
VQVDPNQVFILLSCDKEGIVNFSIKIGDKALEDEQAERDMQNLFCVATGMVVYAKDNPVEAFTNGYKTYKAIREIEDADTGPNGQ